MRDIDDTILRQRTGCLEALGADKQREASQDRQQHENADDGIADNDKRMPRPGRAAGGHFDRVGFDRRSRAPRHEALRIAAIWIGGRHAGFIRPSLNPGRMRIGNIRRHSLRLSRVWHGRPAWRGCWRRWRRAPFATKQRFADRQWAWRRPARYRGCRSVSGFRRIGRGRSRRLHGGIIGSAPDGCLWFWRSFLAAARRRSVRTCHGRVSTSANRMSDFRRMFGPTETSAGMFWRFRPWLRPQARPTVDRRRVRNKYGEGVLARTMTPPGGKRVTHWCRQIRTNSTARRSPAAFELCAERDRLPSQPTDCPG